MNNITDSFNYLLPMLIISVIFWKISLLKKDVSIVDSLWSIFILVAASTAFYQQAGMSDRAAIVMLMVFIWSIRLSLYITLRHWGKAEDHRYVSIRNNNQPGFEYKSLYLIFIFQAVVAWIIAMPVYYAIQSTSDLNILDAIGVSLWVVGMFFESVSDYQLYQFKKKPENAGKLLTQGLWKFSRHPNYFGEFLIWWGFYLIAINGAGYISVISPLLMTYLLLKFSGVNLLEKSMTVKPGYEAYVRRTSVFFPWFVRRDNA